MKMRKLLCLLLSLLMLVSLVACGDKDDSDDEGGSSKTAKPEAVVEKFMDCLIDADAKGMFDLVPDAVLEYAMEQDDMSKSDFDDQVGELSDMLQESYDYVEEMTGEKLKMSYEITDSYEMDEDEVADLQEDYDDADVEIEEAKVFEVDFTMEVAGEEQTQSLEIVVIKVDGKWYVEMGSLEDAF